MRAKEQEFYRFWQETLKQVRRLEAELAKEKAEHKDLLRMIEKDQYDLIEKVWRMEAELADLRASSVVVRRKCETCFGTGHGPYDPVEDIRYMDESCPDCVDGWQLADGVEWEDDPYEGRWLVIPARLIEGKET